MSTRKIIDIEHNGEKVWPKGHAKATFMSSGSTVEDAINRIGTNGKDGADGATFTPSVDSAGNLSWTNNKGLTNPPTVNIKGPKGDKGDAGEGGGGITVETDPIFSASPAASITEDNKAEWDSKYAKPSGGIPKSDLASGVQTSLDKADNSLQVEKFQEMDIVTVNGLAGGNAGLVYALPHEATGDEDDVLLSQKTVKTINGENILGEGDIIIAGGSGGGVTEEYVDNAITEAITKVINADF